MIALGICFAVMLGLSLALPFWWWIMAVPLAYFMLRDSSLGFSAAVGAGSAGLLWLIAGLWMWLMGGADLIAPRVAKAVGANAPAVLLALTVILATLAGGFAGATGFSIRSALRSRSNKPATKS